MDINPYSIVAITFINLAICQGSYFTFSIFYVAILEEFHWSRASTAGVFSLATIVLGTSALLVGWLVDRWGAKKVLVVGIVILALAMAVNSSISSLWQLYVYYSIIGALGISSTGWVPHSSILSKWFTKKRGLIIGLAFSGMGLGMLVLGPFSQHVISNLGWRYAYLILAIIVLIILLPINLLFMADSPKNKLMEDNTGITFHESNGEMNEPRSLNNDHNSGNLPSDCTKNRLSGTSDNTQLPTLPKTCNLEGKDLSSPVLGDQGGRLEEDQSNQPINNDEGDFKRALRSFKFWALFSAIFFTPVAIFPVFTHQIAYAVDFGFDRMLAASVFGILGLMSILGRIIFGSISDRIGRPHAAALSFSCSFIGVILLLSISNNSQVWLLYLYALFFGLGFGARGPLTAAIAVDLFKGKSFGVIYGFLNVGNGIGGAIGPWLGGYIYDQTGSYHLAFIISIAGMIMATASFYMVSRKTSRI